MKTSEWSQPVAEEQDTHGLLAEHRHDDVIQVAEVRIYRRMVAKGLDVLQQQLSRSG
jgi:hypothetical protein